jgi:hypothetical protein
LNMSSPFDPDDLRRQAERAAAASREAAALHDHAMTLGYNVGVGIASEAADRRIHVGPLGKEPEVWFRVWRVDQPSETADTFTSVDSVKEHLKFLATLPRYCLLLEGNPRVAVVTEEDDGARTVITDTDTNQCFAIRTADLENATHLCVHAESPPIIGNWRK